MKEKLKSIYLFNICILIISGIIIWVLFITKTDTQFLYMVIFLCSVFFISSLVISGFYYFSKLHKCRFLDYGIDLCWATWTCRHIDYNEIKGITIRGAVDRTFNPIRNSNKQQKAVISLYSSSSSFLIYMSSEGISVIPSRESDLLCRSFLDVKDLMILLRNTKVTIYITEKMLNTYQDELSDILSVFAERIIVFCDGRILNTYESYIHENID